MTRASFPDIPGQRGLATTSQLLRHGWTNSALTHLVATSGQRILPRVYVPHRRTLDEDDLLVAGWLWAGAHSALTGSHALARHGLDVRPGSIIRFVTRKNGRNREANLGMELRRTRRPPLAIARDGIAIVPVARALVDAARHKEASPADLMGWTISALQRKLTTPERLDAEITASGWLGLGPLTSGCAAFRQGAWSVPEWQLRVLVDDDERLPRMLANPRLITRDGEIIGRPDGYFREAGVAVQVHSQKYHTGVDERGRDRWSLTVAQDARYTRNGITVVPVTPVMLRDTPVAFLDMLADVLAAHQGSPGPDILIEEYPGVQSSGMSD